MKKYVLDYWQSVWISTCKIALGCLACAALQYNLKAQEIFTIGSSDGFGPMSFGKIDIGLGSYTEIRATLPGTDGLLNLSWSQPLQGFYSIQRKPDEFFSSFYGDLRSIDAAGNVSASLGSVYADGYGMSYRPLDGQLYTFDAKSASYWVINPNAGPSESLLSPSLTVGFGPGPQAGGRFAVHGGSLYVSVNDSDTSQGRFGVLGFQSGATFQQLGSSDPAFREMVLASDGNSLFGIVGGDSTNAFLYTINPVTGALSSPTTILGSNIPRYFTGASAVPEPIQGGLLTSLCLATWASRRILLYSRRKRR